MAARSTTRKPTRSHRRGPRLVASTASATRKARPTAHLGAPRNEVRTTSKSLILGHDCAVPEVRGHTFLDNDRLPQSLGTEKILNRQALANDMAVGVAAFPSRALWSRPAPFHLFLGSTRFLENHGTISRESTFHLYFVKVESGFSTIDVHNRDLAR